MQQYKQEILDQIKLYSNKELLEATLGLAGGDDYDGCFTRMGEFEFDELKKELDERLKAVGFLE